ncbi:autotransporter-associated beta strand repeat-containing protein, partial [Rhizobiaceae sp. 2RAB30]
AVSGSGNLEQAGNGKTILTGTHSYTGATRVSRGTLIVNGSIATSSGVTVDVGATIGGSGTIASTVVNGTLSAGNSPGKLTVDGNLTLGASATSVFDLGTRGSTTSPDNDVVTINGNLTIGGTLQTPGAVSGYYRLFNVTGTTTGSFSGVPTGATISTGIPNQVNMLLRNNGQLVQFWDGADLTGNASVDGGSGTWSAAAGNWTAEPGAAGVNDVWRGEVGIFGGTAGTVTVAGSMALQGLQFSADGYQLAGGELFLAGNTQGNTAASFINVDGGVTATIGSV